MDENIILKEAKITKNENFKILNNKTVIFRLIILFIIIYNICARYYMAESNILFFL